MKPILRNRRVLAGLILAGVGSLLATTSSALTITCGERGSSYRLVGATDGVLSVKVDASNAVSWTLVSGKNQTQIDIGNGFRAVDRTGTFSTTRNLAVFRIQMSDPTAKVAVSCNSATAPATSSGASHISADSQLTATTSGLGINAAARLSAQPVAASKNAVYVSTSTSGIGGERFLPADWNLWMTFEGRGYSGGLDGRSNDVVGGIDRLIGTDVLVGVVAGLGQSTVTDIGTPQVVTSPMLGGYIVGNFGGHLVLEGFVSAANPSYAISGANFSTSRVGAGLTVRGAISHRNLAIEPFMSAHSYREQQPTYTTGGGAVIAANSVNSIAASMGVKVSFANPDQSGFSPYVSAAADFRRLTTTANGTDSVLAPRFGMGVQGTLGEGEISVDLDFGKSRSDTYDRGVKFGYLLKF